VSRTTSKEDLEQKKKAPGTCKENFPASGQAGNPLPPLSSLQKWCILKELRMELAKTKMENWAESAE
jgi:hypothetical protein